MRNKIALLLVVTIVLYPILMTNGTSFANTKKSTSGTNNIVLNRDEASKVKFSYLFGSYWEGEIKITVTLNPDNTIMLNSKVTKAPNNGLDAPALTNDIPLNTSFDVQLSGYSVNFTQYFEETNISLANQWNYYDDSSFTSNCNADCQYYTYELQVNLHNGSSYSVINQLPYPQTSKTISDKNSEQSINYTISMMHSLINSYNLTKIKDGQDLSLSLNSNQNSGNNLSPGFEIFSLLVVLPFLIERKKNKKI